MDRAGLSGEEMLAWHDASVAKFAALLVESPEVLDVPCDVYGVKDLRGLLHHCAVVQLRYAQRLHGVAESPYEDVLTDAATIVRTFGQASAMLRELLQRVDYDWAVKQEFVTISWGPARSGRRTMFAHAVLHGIRHFAQAATLARQAGFKVQGAMDYLAMDVERI